LPLATAFDVVWRGFRVRLGRSLVTLTGITLGIAFLMSTLTAQTIRRGVSREIEARAETARMLSVLAAEAGPAARAVLDVVATGALDDAETRLVRALLKAPVEAVRWAGPVPEEMVADARGRLRPADPHELGRQSAAVLILGAGALPAALGEGALVAVTRARPEAAEPIPRSRVIRLQRETLPDERREHARAARHARFRAVWMIAISLLVTAIGIGNAMLMSVTERFREIGALKCLGALSSFVRRIFFIEAALLGLAGSLLGVIGGALLTAGLYAMIYGPAEVVAALTAGAALPLHALLAVASGMLLAVVAAVYPAGVAARMAPAAALRSTL
jgi:hypothetical protein